MCGRIIIIIIIVKKKIIAMFSVVCGSFWRVDKIQNGVTMETEVPK
jgi:hypothetical protein